MFKFSAQPKTILKGGKQPPFQAKATVSKPQGQKAKQSIYVSIGEDLLPKMGEKIIDPNEYFLCDRPKTPVYVPLPTKIDKGTQIPKCDWLLFNFDNEVKPIMEILVAKILQQSKTEIIKENEIEAENQKIHNLKATRNAEIMKTRRLISKEKRRTIEIESRVLERKIRYEMQVKNEQKAITLRQVRFAISERILPRSIELLDAKRLTETDTRVRTQLVYEQSLLSKTVEQAIPLEKVAILTSNVLQKTVDLLVSCHSKKIEEHLQKEFQLRRENEMRASLYQSQLKESQLITFLKAENKRKRKLQAYFDANVFSKFQLVNENDLASAYFLSHNEFFSLENIKKPYAGLVFEPWMYLLFVLRYRFSETLDQKAKRFWSDFLKMANGNFSVNVSTEFNEYVKRIIRQKQQREEVNESEIKEAIDKEVNSLFEASYYSPSFISPEGYSDFLHLIITMKINIVESNLAKLSLEPKLEPEHQEDDPEGAQEVPITKEVPPPVEADLNFEKIVFAVIDRTNLRKTEQNYYYTRLNRKLKHPNQTADEEAVRQFDKQSQLDQFDGTLFESKRRLFKADKSVVPIKAFNYNGFNLFIQNKIALEKLLELACRIMDSGEEMSIRVADQLARIARFEEEYVNQIRKEQTKEFIIFDLED